MKHKLATVVLMGLLLFYGYIVVDNAHTAEEFVTLCIAFIPEILLLVLSAILLKPRIPAMAAILTLLLITRLIVRATMPELDYYIFNRLIGEIAAGEFFLLWYLWRKY